MKYIHLLTLVIVFFFVGQTSTEAQTFRAALVAGGNFTQIDGDELAGFHQTGLQLGGTVMIPFYGNWTANVEILYAQRGAQSTLNGQNPDNSLDLLLNYVELPLMIRYTDKDRLTGGIGVSYSRFLSSKYIRNSVEIELPDGVFKDVDLQLKIDVGYFITDNIYFNAGWATAFTKTNNLNREIEFDSYDLPFIPAADRKGNEIRYINRLIFARVMYILPIGESSK